MLRNLSNDTFLEAKTLCNAFAEYNLTPENLPIHLHELNQVIQVLKLLIGSERIDASDRFRISQQRVNFFLGNTVRLTNQVDQFRFALSHIGVACGQIDKHV